MNYYYNGKKPSSKYSIASGCLIIIAISAIIFLIFSIDSLADLEGHYLQLFLVCIMGFSIFYNFFKKKGKLHTNRIEIINDYLSINNFKVPLKNITLDIYNVDNNFNRYHLWDSNGEFAIYSVFEDDLLKDNKSSFIKNTKFHEELTSSQNGTSISVKSVDCSLYYDLDSGEFTIRKEGKVTFNKTPKLYIYDPKYKNTIKKK